MSHRNCLTNLVLIALISVVASSSRAESSYVFGLDRAQVVPPTASTASGICHVSFTTALDTVIYSIAYDSLGSNRTSADIHYGCLEKTDTVVVHLAGSGGLSDTLSGRAFWPIGLRPLVDDPDFPIAHLYIEIDTVDHSEGEIRGQFSRWRP